MMDKSTYLATVPSEIYERRHERFVVKRPASLLTISNGLGGISERRATLIDISIAGAGLDVSVIFGLPEHYYLRIDGLPNRIGCAEVHRSGNRVGVKFLATIDEALIHKIIRADYLKGR